MAQLSKFPLKSAVHDEIINSFVWLLCRFSSENELNSFLNDFLSDTEKLMFSKRLAIALMVEKGYSYYTIRDTLKVSTSTILRITQWIQKGGKGYRIALNKLSKRESMKGFWDSVAEMVEIIGKGKRVLP